MFTLAAAAFAAPLVAKIDGKKFTPASVVAGPDKIRPGTMWVILSPTAVTCKQMNDPSPPRLTGAVMVGFMDAKAGTATTQIFGTAAEVQGKATLAAIPAVGARGTVSFAVTGAKDSLQGDAEFELCAAIPEKPKLTAELVPTDRKLTQDSMIGGPPAELTVRIGLPKGWTEVPKDKFSPPWAQWSAPDGFTVLAVQLLPPAKDLAAESAEFSKGQLAAYTAPGEAKASSEGPVGTGAYALHWLSRTGPDQPWTHHLEVFRQDAGWPQQVKCSLTTDEAGAAALVEPLRAGCAAIQKL